MGEKHTVIWSGLMSDGAVEVIVATKYAQKFSFTHEMQGSCTTAVLFFMFPRQQSWSIHLCICFHFWNLKCEFFHSFANFLYLQVERKEGPRSSRISWRFWTTWTPLGNITTWPWTPGLRPCIYFTCRIVDDGKFPQIDDAIGWNGIFVCKIKFSYLKWSFSFFFSVYWFSTPVRTVLGVWHNWVLFGSKKSVHTDKGWPIKVQCNLIKMLRLTKLYFIQRGNVGKQVSVSIKRPSLLLLQVLSNEMKPFVRSVKLFKTQNDSIRFRPYLFLSFPFFSPQQTIVFLFPVKFIPEIKAPGITSIKYKTVSSLLE